jgi:hypothetical protein
MCMRCQQCHLDGGMQLWLAALVPPFSIRTSSTQLDIGRERDFAFSNVTGIIN